VRDGLQSLTERALVGIGQQALEGVAGHDDEIEAPSETHAAAISLDPSHGRASGTLARNIQHGARGIHPPDLPACAQRRCQETGSAAEVQHARCLFRQGEAVARVVSPAILGIVELDEFGVLEEPVLHVLRVALLRQIG